MRKRQSLVVGVVLAVVLGGAAVAVTQVGGPDPIPTDSRPLPTGNFGPPDPPLEGSPPSREPMIPMSESVKRAIANSPAVADAPWLFLPDQRSRRYQDEPSRQGLAFPPGISHDDALTQLYVTLATTGGLPDGASLVPPLPAGKVVKLPATPAEGVVIDLRAPWGYNIRTGEVALPSFSFPGTLSPSEVQARLAAARAAGSPLPEGAKVGSGYLWPCQKLDKQASAGSESCALPK